MAPQKTVDIWYSMQSDYCYFLIDKLLELSKVGVQINVRPVLGLILRMPERTVNRDQLEQDYFLRDAQRTADFLGLPYAIPNPSPIELVPGSVWIAADEQPRIKRLFRLFIGACKAGKSLQFLDVIARGIWNGQNIGWDRGSFLPDGLSQIGLNIEELLDNNSWLDTQSILRANHFAMLEVGHWGVPLLVYEGEPFYGQDRFDQLLWRMGVADTDNKIIVTS